VKQVFSDVWQGVKDTTTAFFDSITSFVTQKIEWISQKIRELKNAVVEIATLGMADTGGATGARAVGGYVSGNTPYMVGER